MSYALCRFFLSRFFAAAIVTTPEAHPQHIHDGDISRLGGIAIFASAVWVVVLGWLAQLPMQVLLIVTASFLPAFLLSAAEDLWGRVGPFFRYAACFGSALIAVLGFDVAIPRYDFGLLDNLIQVPVMSAIVASFCIAGVTQSFNIIDGKNGLAVGIAQVALLASVVICWRAGLLDLAQQVLWLIGAILGFSVFNFPAARLFLGDSGAYFLGFCVAVVSVVLSQSIPELSPWVFVVLAALPIFETLFTIMRRIIIEGTRFSDPDYLHLHSLLCVWLECRYEASKLRANWLTTVILTLVSAGLAVLAVLLSDSTSALQGLCVGIMVAYLMAYAALRRAIVAYDN